MKAAYIEAQGGPEEFKYGDLPDPIPAPGEVLVDIHAASVNAADWKRRKGGHYPTITKFPYVLGRDFSGVVAAAGNGVTDLKVGDAVFGICDVGQEGTYCEKIAIKAAIIAKKPDSLTHIEAAALALIGTTALISVEETLYLKPGETILVQGGAGGVAGFGIQLAKHIGATVITTCSAANIDYVKARGADVVIDYRAQDFADVVSDIDAVFDTVGGDVTRKSFAVLKPGGRLATIAAGPKAPPSPREDCQSLRPDVGRDRPHLERTVALFEAGAVTLPEITVFPLKDAAEAHRVSEARHLRGKLILQVR